MKYFIVLCLTSLVIGTASGAQTATGQMLCQMSAQGTRGWIAPEIMVIRGQENQQIAIYDGPVHTANSGEPKAAKVLKQSGGLIRFSWRLKLRATNADRLSVRYTAEFNETDHRIKLRATLLETGQSEFANGVCGPLKTR